MGADSFIVYIKTENICIDIAKDIIILPGRKYKCAFEFIKDELC